MKGNANTCGVEIDFILGQSALAQIMLFEMICDYVFNINFIGEKFSLKTFLSVPNDFFVHLSFRIVSISPALGNLKFATK